MTASIPVSEAMPTRVLVVEDSATQAASLAILLEDAGYAVTIARSGERAVELVRVDPFDVVLSDVMMPGMSGYDLCRRIKTELGHVDLPVILLTSLTDPLDIVRGLECGADSYVTKPYEPDRLLARLAAVLVSNAGRHHATRGEPVTVTFSGVEFSIGADKEQIVELLVASYGDLVRTSEAVRDAERRARFLADAGEQLSSSLDEDVILRTLARVVVPTLADAAIVDAFDESRVARRTGVQHADAARVAHISAIAPPPPGSTSVLRSGEPTAFDVDHDPSALTTDDLALLDELGGRSGLVVPLATRGNVLGVLMLAWAPGRVAGRDDLSFATDLARRAAIAVDNARLYHAAQQATRARDDVLAIVSHDLRNPLHTIRMSGSLLSDMMAEGITLSPELLSKQLGVIGRSAGRANALIQDLLDVSRIEAGRMAVAATAISGATVIEETAAEMSPLFQEKSVTLDHRWAGPDHLVLADRERLAQVFSNLVGNALKFTPAGGRVSISGRADRADDIDGGSRLAHFAVEDSGSGIAADHLPHLFDRFWQANRASRAGAGLGLFITKGIIEAHGGAIVVESEPGSGSVFRFTIPLAGLESRAADG